MPQPGWCLGARGDVLACCGELGGIPLRDFGDAFAGELTHRLLAGVLRKAPQRRGGRVVVVAVHMGVAGRRQDVCTGWPSAAAPDSGGGLLLLDRALLDERVEMTTDRGGRQPQPGGQKCRGKRTILGDRLSDPVPGAHIESVPCGVESVRAVRNEVVGD